MDATNWRGKQAIRFGVVNRKVWGGNRTWPGAAVQSTLMSVAQTCIMRGLSPVRFLVNALTATTPLLVPAWERQSITNKLQKYYLGCRRNEFSCYSLSS
jgi:hypothetical protein